MMATWWWRQVDDMNMTCWGAFMLDAEPSSQNPKQSTQKNDCRPQALNPSQTLNPKTAKNQDYPQSLSFSRCTKYCKCQRICSSVASIPWNAWFSWYTEVLLRTRTWQNLELFACFLPGIINTRNPELSTETQQQKHDYRGSVFLSKCTKCCKYQWIQCPLANTPWNPGVSWCFPVLLRSPTRQNIKFSHVFLPKPCFLTSSPAHFPARSTREDNMFRRA